MKEIGFELWFSKRLPDGIFSNDKANMKAAEAGFKELLEEAYGQGVVDSLVSMNQAYNILGELPWNKDIK